VVGSTKTQPQVAEQKGKNYRISLESF